MPGRARRGVTSRIGSKLSISRALAYCAVMRGEVADVGTEGLPPTRRSWSTEDVQPRDALAYWCDSICQVMLELDIRAAGGDFFSAQLDQYGLGPATANFLRATPQSVARTRGGISRSNSDGFLLVHLRDGEFELEHYGTVGPLAPWRLCVLLDSGEPYKVRCPRSTRCLVLQLPQQWLRAWLPKPEALAGESCAPTSVGLRRCQSRSPRSSRPDWTSCRCPLALLRSRWLRCWLWPAGRPGWIPHASDALAERLFRMLRDRYHEIGSPPRRSRAIWAFRHVTCTTSSHNDRRRSATSWWVCGCGGRTIC